MSLRAIASLTLSRCYRGRRGRLALGQVANIHDLTQHRVERALHDVDVGAMREG